MCFATDSSPHLISELVLVGFRRSDAKESVVLASEKVLTSSLHNLFLNFDCEKLLLNCQRSSGSRFVLAVVGSVSVSLPIALPFYYDSHLLCKARKDQFITFKI